MPGYDLYRKYVCEDNISSIRNEYIFYLCTYIKLCFIWSKSKTPFLVRAKLISISYKHPYHGVAESLLLRRATVAKDNENVYITYWFLYKQNSNTEHLV